VEICKSPQKIVGENFGENLSENNSFLELKIPEKKIFKRNLERKPLIGRQFYKKGGLWHSKLNSLKKVFLGGKFWETKC